MSPLTASVEKLTHLLSPAQVSHDPAVCARFAVEGLVPAAVVEPETPEQVGEIVGWARAQRAALVPVGSGCLLGIGGIPDRVDVGVSLGRLNSVLHYDPGDLTLGVGAGMKLARLQEALAEHNQFLPINPLAAAQAHLGGLLATNQSGPWRYAYGSWRDFVLGMRFVTGTGKLVRTGGRVVKNVAGYDLSKLLIGSLGTLGIIVDVNFKAFPRPPERATWLAAFTDLKAALGLRAAIVHSPLQPMAIDLLDAAARKLLASPAELSHAPWTLLVEAGGPVKVLDRYDHELSERARQARAASFERLLSEPAAKIWAGVCDFAPRVHEAEPRAAILKASLLLTKMEPFLVQASQTAQRYGLATAVSARAGSGIVCFALLPGSVEDPVERVAQAATEMIHHGTSLDGRVTIEWAPTAVKRTVNVWGPARNDLSLMQRLKAEFDPDRVLNPGRFVARI